MSIKEERERRAHAYAQRHGLVLGKALGFGVHGSVFTVQSQRENDEPNGETAIKVHERAVDYARERDVYLRLQVVGIASIRGCKVPQLIRYDDELLVIEMTVVGRPFVLDFAGAFLDTPPDFSEEVMADWRAEKHQQFGPRWPEVQAILQFLEGLGIYMIDVHPGNISWSD